MNESPDLQNVIFDGQGSFKIRRGFQILGTRDDTTGDIITMWNFRRPISNDNILVRQNDSDQTLEYYHTGTGAWEAVPIVGSLTANLKLGYAEYTSTTDVVDYLYYCDGSINLQRWNGGHTILDGALSGGEGTVTVDSTSGFNASGSIDIGGSTVTYSGKTSTTFTGCSGTPAASDNAPVEQVADDFAASSGTKPKGNVLAVFQRQLVVGVNQFVYFSDTNDFTDWGTGLYTATGLVGGNATALQVKDKKLIAYTTNTIDAIDIEFKDDLSGFQVRQESIEDTPLYGAKNFIGVARADGELFHVSADNAIRRVVRSSVTTLFDTGSICKNIYQGLLEKYTLDNAAMVFFKNKLYIACQSPEGSINDTVLVYDFERAQENESQEAWSKWSLYVGCWAVYGGELHFGSSADANVYRMFTDATTGNDLLTDNGSPVAWYYKTPQLDFGKPELRHAVVKVIERGFVSTSNEISYQLLMDYGTEVSSTLILDGADEDYVSTPAIISMGDEAFGESALADGEDPFEGEYPFTYPDEYGEYHAYNTQLKISGSTAEAKYKHTRSILYVEMQADDMTI